MNFRRFGFVVLLGLWAPFLTANAAKIANLSVTADADHLNILWDKLSDTDFGSADGYAIQWSDRQTDVKITKSANIYQSNNVDDIKLRRASFENNLFYYARVYTYQVDGNNRKVLGNGSDMMKFKVDFLNQATIERIAVTDPVIASSSTGTAQDVSDFEFGELRKFPYDTFSDFFWSRPAEMATSDFDGFMIVISEKSDLSDPLVEARFSRDVRNARITGLKSGTQYYGRGYFYKSQGGENKTFGDSPIKAFKTIPAVPRDGSTRASRNIIKVEKQAVRKVDAGSGDSNQTATGSSSTNSASTTSTVTTTSQSEINRADQARVKQKIAELKKQISTLQSELRRWEAKLDSKTTASSRTISSRSQSSSQKMSIRERLRLILAAKRGK